MAIRRFFYVTQDALVVWCAVGQELSEEISFSSTDAGFKSFAAYIEHAPRCRSLMVVDVIEEEFDTDTIPKVSYSDRNDLIDRRLKKRFSRTPYRLSIFLGGRRRASDSFNLVLTAITNHELVDPWIEIIERHKLPLIGVTSVSLISADLLRDFRKPAENSMFVTRHQGGRLRLIFMKAGQPISARLSRDIAIEADSFSTALVSEITQSRKYLERSRRLSPDDQLDVYFVADGQVAEMAFAEVGGANFRAHVIEADLAARQLGLSRAPSPGNMEAIYLARCVRKRPRLLYGLRDRINYSSLLMVRHAAIGFAVASAVCCSVAAGILLSGALAFRTQSQSIDAQIAQIEETFRRENDEFEPVRADSYEMKLAVDTSDYIVSNSLPVDWVMRELSRVMGDQPDMHIDQLVWEVEPQSDPANSRSPQNANDRRQPISISAAAAVSARLSGEIYPYDGNLRHAFAKIDRLAVSIKENTAFAEVAVDEYPINANPGASVSGEVRQQGTAQLANFSLTMTLRIADEVD